jgi:hypothetical protein
MIIPLAIISSLFVAISFIVTEKNARYILAGYNTMSVAERSAFDLKSYIPFFRKFYIFLGISLFVVGYLLNFLVNANAAGVFLIFYPIVAHFYSISKTTSFYKGGNAKKYKKAFIILGGILLLVTIIFSMGNRENQLTFDSQKIEINGMYGEVLTPDEIKSIELVKELPEITLKTNGYAVGSVQKGYFKTKSGDNVKLIINADHPPFILFTNIKGKKIYYSAKSKSNKEIFNELKNAFPGIEYK